MAALLAVFTRPALTQQQGGSFVLNPSTIAGGGGTAVNGSTRIDATIGQPVVASSINDTLTVDSGFWTPTPTLPISYFVTDLDGDGKSDIGFYRAGLWGFLKSTQSYSTGAAQFFSWGGSGLQPVIGDFDGDAKAGIGYIVPRTGG